MRLIFIHCPLFNRLVLVHGPNGHLLTGEPPYTVLHPSFHREPNKDPM